MKSGRATVVRMLRDSGATSTRVRPLRFIAGSLCVLAASCGSAVKTAAPPIAPPASSIQRSTAPSGNSNPTAATSGSSNVPAELTHVYAGAVSAPSSGDKSSFRLALGALRAIKDSAGGTQVCGANEQRDLAAPFSFSVANDNTGSFSAEVSATFAALYGSDASPGLSAAIVYSDGPKCVQIKNGQVASGGGSLLSCKSTGQVPAGQSVTCSGWIILAGVASPAFPTGDAKSLAATYLWLQSVSSVVNLQFKNSDTFTGFTNGPRNELLVVMGDLK
jgi:hypothetical protein